MFKTINKLHIEGHIIPQNNKSNIMQTYSQYHTEWAKAGSIPLENQHKARTASLTTPIQHIIRSSGQGNQARQRNKGREEVKLSFFEMT